MGIPLYGQEKDGNALDSMSAYQKTVKVFDIFVDADSPDNDADTGIKIPGGSIVTHCSITNIGATALAGGAKTLDLGGVDLTASLASLAAGASVAMDGVVPVYTSADANILVDANIYTSSSNTTLRVIVEYYSPNANSDSIELLFSAGTD